MKKYNLVFRTSLLWKILALSTLISFSILLFFGREIYQMAPPMPSKVETDRGDAIFSLQDIQRGQNVWQSLGGMQKGSIWGHGSYLAPDWSADWLHRESIALLDIMAGNEYGKPFSDLDEGRQESLKAYLRLDIRKNTWDSASDTLTLGLDRYAAIKTVSAHYSTVFQAIDSDESRSIREQYAFSQKVTISDEDMHALNAFIFWTSWSAVTNRPDDTISYTSNWPYEPLVGNTPPQAC